MRRKINGSPESAWGLVPIRWSGKAFLMSCVSRGLRTLTGKGLQEDKAKARTAREPPRRRPEALEAPASESEVEPRKPAQRARLSTGGGERWGRARRSGRSASGHGRVPCVENKMEARTARRPVRRLLPKIQGTEDPGQGVESL